MTKCLPAAERNALAAEQTDTWAVWIRLRGKAGADGSGQERQIEARSEAEALRKGGKLATRARPWLPTSEWLKLPPPCPKKRRSRNG